MLLMKSLIAGMCDPKTILCYKKYDRALTSLLATYFYHSNIIKIWRHNNISPLLYPDPGYTGTRFLTIVLIPAVPIFI